MIKYKIIATPNRSILFKYQNPVFRFNSDRIRLERAYRSWQRNPIRITQYYIELIRYNYLFSKNKYTIKWGRQFHTFSNQRWRSSGKREIFWFKRGKYETERRERGQKYLIQARYQFKQKYRYGRRGILVRPRLNRFKGQLKVRFR